MLPALISTLLLLYLFDSSYNNPKTVGSFLGKFLQIVLEITIYFRIFLFPVIALLRFRRNGAPELFFNSKNVGYFH